MTDDEWLLLVLERLAAYGYCPGASETNRELVAEGLAEIVGSTDEYAELTEKGKEKLSQMRRDEWKKNS